MLPYPRRCARQRCKLPACCSSRSVRSRPRDCVIEACARTLAIRGILSVDGRPWSHAVGFLCPRVLARCVCWGVLHSRSIHVPPGFDDHARIGVVVLTSSSKEHIMVRSFASLRPRLKPGVTEATLNSMCVTQRSRYQASRCTWPKVGIAAPRRHVCGDFRDRERGATVIAISRLARGLSGMNQLVAPLCGRGYERFGLDHNLPDPRLSRLPCESTHA
jgi:hypothetical protein